MTLFNLMMNLIVYGYAFRELCQGRVAFFVILVWIDIVVRLVRHWSAE